MHIHEYIQGPLRMNWYWMSWQGLEENVGLRVSALQVPTMPWIWTHYLGITYCARKYARECEEDGFERVS